MSKANHAIRLRAPAAHDVDELLILEAKCFDSYHRGDRFSRRQFRYYLNNKNTIAFVVMVDGTLVGYVLGLIQRGQRKQVSRLYSIAVLPHARKSGLASALLRRFEQEVRRRGVRRVSLEVAAKNKAARGLLQGNGFKQTRKVEDYYGKGLDGLRMEKFL